jgi:smad nuclear-interacting protein 1
VEQEKKKPRKHEVEEEKKPSIPKEESSSDSSDSDSSEHKKELPNFRPSGKLQAAAMELNGVTLKYAEPPSARMAPKGWRLYEFKGEEQLDTIKLDGKSVFRIGRDERVCPLTMLHNSISSQHAAIQFREVERKNRFDDNGAPVREIVPAIIDLKSTNGTKLNGAKIQDSIYIELKQQDVLQFGDSTREYVVIEE